jgi:flagellin-like protein
LKDKSGISPVIAALILVAIAVVLVSALSGFASSMLGTYSYSPLISVHSLEVQPDGTGRIIFYNDGARSDSVVGLQVIPNAPMDLVPDTGTVITNQHQTSDDGGAAGGDEGASSEHLPQCQEHTDLGNCMHDQDKGNSGSSSGHQAGNTDGAGSNTGNSGSSTNGGSGQGNNGSHGNPVGKYSAEGIFLPPYAEIDISWAESSVGDFSSGEKITVLIYLQSGHRLTYSALVS